MSKIKEVEINLKYFKISKFQIFRNFIISLIALIIFLFSIYYFLNNTFTYSANYQIRINDYDYDQFLKNYATVNTNLFGGSFNDFGSNNNTANVLYDRNLLLNEISKILSINSIKKNSLNENYLILTFFKRNQAKQSINFNVNHNFIKTYSDNSNLSNIKLETSQVANSLYNDSYEKFNLAIHKYLNELFEIYKIKTIQELENFQTIQELESLKPLNSQPNSMTQLKAKNEFMLNLIMEFIVSTEQSEKEINEVLRKSNIYMQILNEMTEPPIKEVYNESDNKVAFYKYQIEEIKNLQYQLNKVNIDFIEFNLVEEINPDLNFYNIKIIFILLVFLFLSNLVLAFFSK